MSGSPRTGLEDVHPFRALWETRDLDAFADALAPGVVLHSPILKTPFRGRDAAAELYGVLLNVMADVELTDEFADGDVRVFFWRADIDGRIIEGADLLRSDKTGKISEVTVHVRPLVDIAAFAAAVGPPLARRRGPIRGALLRVLTLPLRVILVAADLFGTRLVQRR